MPTSVLLIATIVYVIYPQSGFVAEFGGRYLDGGAVGCVAIIASCPLRAASRRPGPSTRPTQSWIGPGFIERRAPVPWHRGRASVL
jgi:hypothetical protein